MSSCAQSANIANLLHLLLLLPLAAGASGPQWGGASVICIVHGKQDQDVIYKKSLAFQLHVTGYEMPDTAMVLTKAGTFFVLSSSGKCRYGMDTLYGSPGLCGFCTRKCC